MVPVGRTGEHSPVPDGRMASTRRWGESTTTASTRGRPGMGFFSGASRQANNIIWLSKSYRYTNNDSFLIYATNYANGVAGECDVWSGDYDCGDAEDQNLMIQAYLEIYDLTGNITYLNIAKELNNNHDLYGYTNQGIISQSLMYKFANNLTALIELKKHVNQTMSECVDVNCTLYNKIKNVISYNENYFLNSNYETKFLLDKKYYGDHESNCDVTKNNYQCDNNENQALYSYMLMNLPFDEDEKGIFQITFNQTPEILKPIKLFAKANGKITNPILYYKKMDSVV